MTNQTKEQRSSRKRRTCLTVILGLAITPFVLLGAIVLFFAIGLNVYLDDDRISFGGDRAAPPEYLTAIPRYTPQWSPDGRYISFEDQKSDDVYVVNREGTELHRITERDGRIYAPLSITPQFSPDSRRLVYATLKRSRDRPKGDPNRMKIEISNLDGSNKRLLVDNDYDNAKPAWSPGGSEIAFHREDFHDSSKNSLMLVEVNGSEEPREVVKLGRGYGLVGNPMWMPDGESLIFVTERISSESYDYMEVKTVDVSGGNMRTVFSTDDLPYTRTEEPIREAKLRGLPELSPDGKTLGMLLYIHGNPEYPGIPTTLFLIDLETGGIEAKIRAPHTYPRYSEPRYDTPVGTGQVDRGPYWSPDSQSLLIAINGEEIETAMVSDSKFKRLTPGLYGAWSPQQDAIAVIDSRKLDYLRLVTPDGYYMKTLVRMGHQQEIFPAHTE